MESKSIKWMLPVFLILAIGCGANYVETKATITNLELNFDQPGNHLATIEYSIDSVTYTKTFEIDVQKMVEDSISMPHPGIEFMIRVNPEDPDDAIVDYDVKPVYK